MTPTTQFVHGTRHKADRLGNEKWEHYRMIIIKNYKDMSLEKLVEHMAREYDFHATSRQFGHRLREVWGERKYKLPKEPCQTQGLPSLEKPVLLDESKSGTNIPPCPTPPSQSAALARKLSIEVVPPSAPAPYAAPERILLIRPQRYIPVLDSTDTRFRLLLLAAILRALGDDHYAHVIYTALWHREESEPSISDCVRTAQTIEQAEEARSLLEELGEIPTEEAERSSWRVVLWDFFHAHTYNWGQDIGDAFAQIGEIIGEIVDGSQDRAILKPLVRRDGLPLDVLAYSSLASALVRYNQITDLEHPRNQITDPEHPALDFQDILDQFLKQQPALASDQSLQQINCLPSCLEWCRDALNRGLLIPANDSDNSGSTTDACKLLCGLWYSWMGAALPSLLSTSHPQAPAPSGGSSSSSGGNPSWALNAQSQLGISATELLSTVVWMIMAAAATVPQDKPPSSSHPSSSTASASSYNDNSTTIPPHPSSQPLLTPLPTAKSRAALTAAKTLLSLHRRDLAQCFLAQVLATDQRAIIQPCDERQGYDGGIVRYHTGPECCCGRGFGVGVVGGGDARAIEPFRRFVAGVLGVGGLPDLTVEGVGMGMGMGMGVSMGMMGMGMERVGGSGGVDGYGDMDVDVDPNLDRDVVGVEAGEEVAGGYNDILGAQVNEA